mgnify:CR=1 FL=1
MVNTRTNGFWRKFIFVERRLRTCFQKRIAEMILKHFGWIQIFIRRFQFDSEKSCGFETCTCIVGLKYKGNAKIIMNFKWKCFMNINHIWQNDHDKQRHNVDRQIQNFCIITKRNHDNVSTRLFNRNRQAFDLFDGFKRKFKIIIFNDVNKRQMIFVTRFNKQPRCLTW